MKVVKLFPVYHIANLFCVDQLISGQKLSVVSKEDLTPSHQEANCHHDNITAGTISTATNAVTLTDIDRPLTTQ